MDGVKLAAILRNIADAVWLADRVSKLPTCNECAVSRECEYVPKWGEPVRYNCPLYQGKRGEKNDG